jgi:hypothetical protein
LNCIRCVTVILRHCATTQVCFSQSGDANKASISTNNRFTSAPSNSTSSPPDEPKTNAIASFIEPVNRLQLSNSHDSMPAASITHRFN